MTDFDQIEARMADQSDEPEMVPEVEATAEEIERARALLAATERGGNRAARRARPANAPAPTDRLPKRTEQQDEADGRIFRITLWDREFDVDPEVFIVSLDVMAGRTTNDPLRMVRGIIGAENFDWFLMTAANEGLNGVEAAKTVMDLVKEAMPGNR